MKVKIMSDDGALEGWFIALCTTAIVYILLILGFFFSSIAEAWKVMGGYVSTIYPLSFGTWLAYKAAKAIGGA